MGLNYNQKNLLNYFNLNVFKRQFICDIFGQNHDLYYENLKNLIYNKLDQNKEQLDTIEEYTNDFKINYNLKWIIFTIRLGLLSEDLIPKCGNPIDSLGAYLSKRLVYGKKL